MIDILLDLVILFVYACLGCSLYYRLFLYNPIKGENELMERYTYRRHTKWMRQYEYNKHRG